MGDPGTLKTPICGDVLFPLGHLESKATEEYKDKKINYEADKTLFLETKSSLEKRIKDCIDQDQTNDLLFLREELANNLKKEPPEPSFIRYRVSDTADGKRERDITLTSIQKAALWCTYLESHARRIYGMVLDTTFEAVPTLSKAEELLAWMRKQSSRSDQPLKRRFILRYSKFRSSKELDPLLFDLTQMGYIQEGPQGAFGVLVENRK